MKTITEQAISATTILSAQISQPEIIATEQVVVDAELELFYTMNTLSDGTVQCLNEDGQPIDLTRFNKLLEVKNGDHKKIYTGFFRPVYVWRNEVAKQEWRWERPMFAHRYEDKLLILNMDEAQNGIELDDGDIAEVDMDVEVIYRRAIQKFQDQGFTFLAGKSKKLVFLLPGVKPEQVLGKVWTNFVAKNKGSDSQFVAGMLLRPGLQTEESKRIPLPMRRATVEMDGVGIVFNDKDWQKLLAAYGLDSSTATLQCTYANPKTGAAFKGTISVETEGRPEGTYTETWKYLGEDLKSINVKYLSVMNSDFIINSRSSFNNQMSYYELNNAQRHRLTKDFQLALDNISDLSSLAGAGHVITAGHLVKEGLNPFWGTSADEVNEIRTNMALKACRNTPIKGWMLIVQPSLDMTHDCIRVPKQVYRVFKRAEKEGLFKVPGFYQGMMKALTQRHPTLPTGGSMQKFKVVGISKGNTIEIGMRKNSQCKVDAKEFRNLELGTAHTIEQLVGSNYTQWGSAQLGDFDGDQMVIFDPFWVAERLADFKPLLVNNQEKYKPEKRQTESTDVNTRINMMIKEASIAIGMGDSLARQAIDNDCASPELLEQCALAVQSAITSKKYETDEVELKRPKGMKTVKACAFEQLKKLTKGQDVDAFAEHWMLPAVVQALETADMHTASLEYSTGNLKDAFAQVSLMFSQAALAEAMEMAGNLITEFQTIQNALKETTDAHQRQELNQLLKHMRTQEIPMMVETQGAFALWEPKGFIGNLTTEQDMRRALIALAIAHMAPNELRIWAQAMDKHILELFLYARSAGEMVLLTGGTPIEKLGEQFVELDVQLDGTAWQNNQRVARFAVDKTIPEPGLRLFEIKGGTDRRMILTPAE